MKTILFSFDTDVERDRFLKAIKEAADAIVTRHGDDEVANRDGKIIMAALNTVKLDPPIKADHERVVALFVGGQKMAEGTLADMRKRFRQEVDTHSATVELRELRSGEWKVIQSRRRQQ